MKQYFFYFFLISLYALVGCQDKKDPDVSAIKAEVSIQRFDSELMVCQSKEEIQKLLQKNEYFARIFYGASHSDTAFINHLDYLIHHPETRALYEQAATKFGDLSDMKKELEGAFKHIKYYYPEFKEPKIITTFTALEKDLFISDSLVVISLESFIGKNAKYRPQQPNYILTRYDKLFIVPSIITFFSSKYNKVDDNNHSLLADMIYYGKSLEFTKAMLPNTPDSLIIGYADSTLQKTNYAQDLVWANFIDNKLLYEESTQKKGKYLDERPNVPEIGPECPGRIGQWLGWRIVRRYRTENPTISLQDLMKNSDVATIFEQSKYRGQIDEE